MREGAQDYLIKGQIDGNLLVRAMRYAIERKRMEQALRESEEHFRALIENTSDIITVTGDDGIIHYLSPSVERVLGYSRGELVGKQLLDYFHPDDKSGAIVRFAELVQSPESVSSIEFRFRHKDGSWRDLEAVGKSTVGNSRAASVIVNSRDITERKRAEEELRERERTIRELSLTDELTGLYNRRRFYEALETEIYRTQRYGHPFSLAILDLDGFKPYNDNFGHSSGDRVLQSMAQTLRSSLRKVDSTFRYGGDEFTIILPATDAEKARKIVDRIRSKWSQAPKPGNVVLETPLGFSAGIAQFPENAETADGLVFLGDTALYRSKKEGGYKTTVVSELGVLSTDVLDRATLDQVYALAATVDARDPYTYGHSKRVAALSQMIGRAIGLSTDELTNLHAAGLLHDIGKVGVPDSILTKPAKPTKDEWKLIREHSSEGARIVSHTRELAGLIPMIRHHHEWYNGSGYPDGLRGEDIPLGARIISIADAYDTMTTKRTYRDVISEEEALEELRRCSGSQFDRELVEALCRVIHK
jgi:diguanylate cyclase (GGDEF)-like protein/PAS domain S-box-containing protein/putative nucleotidyltransferase with HDIG domain